MSRSRRLRLVAFVVLVLMPLLELYVLVQVGQVIGAGWTIALLVVSGIAGTWLIRHEGGRAWHALREAIEGGRMPANELADGGLILLGGALMLAPGFVTDAFGVLLILPFTRPVFRLALAAMVARRITVVDVTRPGRGPEGPVVRGEVVDED